MLVPRQPWQPINLVVHCAEGNSTRNLDSGCRLLSVVAQGALGTVHQAMFQGSPVMVKVLQALPGVMPDVMNQKLSREVDLHVSRLHLVGSTT